MKVQSLIEAIEPLDRLWYKKAAERSDQLIKPVGSLGKLEAYYAQLSAIQQTLTPEVDKRAVLVFSGDHGVIEEGVAVCAQEVTLKQTLNFARGYTGVCAIAKQANAKIYPIDIAVNADIVMKDIINKKLAYGTNNIAHGPAMTRENAERAILIGAQMVAQAIADGHNILACGEMGICNTTPSAAILSVLTGRDAQEVTGMGANLDTARVKHKIEVVRQAIRVNQPDQSDAIDILSKIGGYEIAAMCGAFLGAARCKCPMIIDGFIATISAILAIQLAPATRDYLIASHKSREKGAKIANDLLGIDAPLDMDMRLGEGSGAALMFNILEAACYMGIEMITFDEAGIDVV